MTSFCIPVSAQIIVGHRGASFDAPENTLAAFREAWTQQADGVEGDFYFTKDNQIVCIHDADTERTGGKKLKVADSTLAELRTLEYGSWKSEKYRGEPIPTFAEVLSAIAPQKKFVIELKTGPEIIPLLKAELDRLQPDRSRLLIIAFDKATCAASKAQIPDVRVHWLTGYRQNKITGVWQPTLREVADDLKQSQADGLGTQSNRKIVTPEFLQQLRAAGMQEFHVWTVDDPADAIYFRSQGAVGITTNRPAFLREHLAK